MRTGFIGLGHLGHAIAQRLEQQSVELLLWNRTREKVTGLKGEVAANPAEVISGCNHVILNLFGSRAVREVLTMPQGLLSGDCSGKLVIDTTTNHFHDVREFYELCGSRGVTYLESPIAGSVVPALSGKLTVLVSGDKAAYESVIGLFNRFALAVYYLAEPGLATKMKLINNMVLGTFMASISEATALAESFGLERELVMQILSDGAGNSGVLNAKKQRLIERDFSPHFAVAAILKDLNYLGELANESGSEALTAATVKDLFRHAAEAGLADQDFCAVYDLLSKSYMKK